MLAQLAAGSLTRLALGQAAPAAATIALEAVRWRSTRAAAAAAAAAASSGSDSDDVDAGDIAAAAASSRQQQQGASTSTAAARSSSGSQPLAADAQSSGSSSSGSSSRRGAGADDGGRTFASFGGGGGSTVPASSSSSGGGSSSSGGGSRGGGGGGTLPASPPLVPSAAATPTAAAAAFDAASPAGSAQQQQHVLEPAPIPEVLGRVHSTESFSAVDGPGVRFLVFLQGCAMRCPFCSNPDTWPPHAGEQVSSKEVAAAVKRVAPYLRPGGGGVTCSGGEPLLQPAFTAAVFQEAHALGLTTCLDTTGQGSKHHNWDVVLPHTDMVLFCIKHLDPQKYTALTGLRQTGALRFADELSARRVPFWLRFVLIPGHTDDALGLERLVRFCRAHAGALQGVELLPYHQLGVNKWRELGLKYPLEGVATPPLQETLRVVRLLEDAGVQVICDEKRRGAAAEALAEKQRRAGGGGGGGGGGTGGGGGDGSEAL